MTSFISTDSEITGPQFGRAWRDEAGAVHATVLLGVTRLFLDSLADADAVIAAVTEARGALAALEAEAPQPGQPDVTETPEEPS